MVNEKLLKARIERLNKLIETNAPQSIIGEEVFLIFQAGMLLYPTDFLNSLNRWIKNTSCEEK